MRDVIRVKRSLYLSQRVTMYRFLRACLDARCPVASFVVCEEKDSGEHRYPWVRQVPLRSQIMAVPSTLNRASRGCSQNPYHAVNIQGMSYESIFKFTLMATYYMNSPSLSLVLALWKRFRVLDIKTRYGGTYYVVIHRSRSAPGLEVRRRRCARSCRLRSAPLGYCPALDRAFWVRRGSAHDPGDSRLPVTSSGQVVAGLRALLGGQPPSPPALSRVTGGCHGHQ